LRLFYNAKISNLLLRFRYVENRCQTVIDEFRDLVLLVGADPLFLQPQDWRVLLLLAGRSVARLSRLVWDQEVASSNLAAPTKTNKAFASAKAFLFPAGAVRACSNGAPFCTYHILTNALRRIRVSITTRHYILERNAMYCIWLAYRVSRFFYLFSFMTPA
jgi:hypothetical protein